MANYYNDNDPFCCAWLRALIADGLIPEGEVDDRSIADIEPKDLDGFIQCHFFAGIGGWPYAFRLAGWPDERPAWTGSCPCQPFSVAGKGGGLDDERHLWPAFRWLIAQRRPSAIFGEQVASADGRTWLAGVRSDLEAMGYAVGAADLCAAGVGAPHIRQRLWWVGYTHGPGPQGHGKHGERAGELFVGPTGASGWVADTKPQHDGAGESGARRRREPSDQSDENQIQVCLRSRCDNPEPENTMSGLREDSERNGDVSFWSTSVLIPCADGKWRRVPGKRVAEAEKLRLQGVQQRGKRWHQPDESGEQGSTKQRLEIEPALFPLATGLPNRLGTLRGAGNAIVPQVAAEFIKCVMDEI